MTRTFAHSCLPKPLAETIPNALFGSDNEGFLRLYHPELTWSRPILFFELYDIEVAGVRSTQTNNAMAEVNAFQMHEAPASSQETNQTTIRVFPNPTREVVHVELGAEMNATYQVFNSMGALVQEGIATTSFQLSLPISGEHLLRVQTNQGVFYERISVVR